MKQPPRTAAVLLAAGESSRMGSPKALLPWFGASLLEYQVAQLLETATSTVVVLGHDADRIAEAVTIPPGRVAVVVNPLYRLGPHTSIRAGVEALPHDIDAVLVQAVDHPLPASVLRSIISAHFRQGRLVTVPTHLGQRGHPPVFSATLRPDLLSLTEERQGLRELMRRYLHGTAEVALSAPELLLNINTPEDYHQALKQFKAAL